MPVRLISRLGVFEKEATEHVAARGEDRQEWQVRGAKPQKSEVERAQSSQVVRNGTRRQLSLLEQVDLVFTNVLQA